jgi:hypothetical protein
VALTCSVQCDVELGSAFVVGLKSKNVKIKGHRILILFGCETWSLMLREEQTEGV